jgi:hypothetical protein
MRSCPLDNVVVLLANAHEHEAVGEDVNAAYDELLRVGEPLLVHVEATGADDANRVPLRLEAADLQGNI